jgi:hypothetical protein
MLTIKNYTQLNQHTFTIRNGQEWIVMAIEERDELYTIAVLPRDTTQRVWALGGAIIFKLDRTAVDDISNVSDGRYKLSNNKDNRIQYMPSRNLTLSNFKLEIQVQTALTC